VGVISIEMPQQKSQQTVMTNFPRKSCGGKIKCGPRMDFWEHMKKSSIKGLKKTINVVSSSFGSDVVSSNAT
jgi:hypothetical protein